MQAVNRNAIRKRLAKHASTPKLISHRAGTKAEAAHRYVRINRKRPGVEVVKEIKTKFHLTPATARNWYQTFKKHPMDLTPRA